MTTTPSTPAQPPRPIRWAYWGLSLASILGVWGLLTTLAGPTLMPGPLATLEFLGREWERGRLQWHVGLTLGRVMAAFGLAMLLGVTLGVLVGLSRRADLLLEAWTALGLTVPRIIPIMMAYLLVGLNDGAAVLAVFVVVLPTVVVQVREGVRSLDYRLVQMAQAFDRRPAQIGLQVMLPQLTPHLLGTARNALSLAWKMIVFAELLGRTGGVGYQIAFYFNTLEMRGILAYGLAMTVVLALVDRLFVELSERAGRWRGERG